MSVSVKSISVSINGILSEQFHIEINGSAFTMESFSLSQTLLQPCRLSFGLQKDTDENAEDVNFKVCQDIIGQNIALVLQTEAMEADLDGYEDDGQQTGNIEFKGFIVSANASRSGADYYISVEALSHDARMQTFPHCYMYNDYQLKDIIKEHLADYEGYLIELEGEVETKREIHYTVQYNESDYEFMQRLAMRHQEWMFSTGTKLHFGKLEDQESIKLTYPSENLSDYSVDLHTQHQNYNIISRLYNSDYWNIHDGTYHEYTRSPENNGNILSDTAYGMSLNAYPKSTWMVANAQEMESDPALKSSLEKEGNKDVWIANLNPAFVVHDSIRANLVHYRGRSTCARLKIGTKLTIMDDFISGEDSQKNEVQQDEILITEVYHSFGVNGEYSNSFEGVPSAINFPPYPHPRTYPRCDHPVQAFVVDTEDPEHLGRIRVRFNWQTLPYQGKKGNKEKNGMTPWIIVAQQYSLLAYDGGKTAGGTHLIPELYSSVMVDFEGGNFERPFVSTSFPQMSAPIPKEWYPGYNNVKAIRTASGHTIEIHDTQDEENYGEKGYIKVYDNVRHTYELLLSTDRALVKLRSSGNIELDASKDIIMTAGENITMKAKKKKINMEAQEQINSVSHGSYTVKADSSIVVNTTSDMKATANDEIVLRSKEDRFEIRAKQSVDVKSEQASISIIASTGMGNKGDETVFIKSAQGIKLEGGENFVADFQTGKYTVEAQNLTLNPKMNMEMYAAQFKMSVTGTGSLSFNGPLDVTGMPGSYH